MSCRAFENIVRNAVYHTPPESPIEIFTEKCTEKNIPSIRITVRDHGRGVPEDLLPLIFKPFFKIATTDQHRPGAGLGLAISEAAVRFHQGDIRARNAQDGGLIVEILLPKSLSPRG
jgi:two-component system sensor histidine kinase CpxA